MRGAIGFAARPGVLSWLIRWATKSRWSHAFIILSHEIGPSTRILHSAARGVEVAELEPYIKPGAECAIFQVGGTDEDVERAITYAHSFLGEPYGWLQLLGFIPVLLFRGIRKNPTSKGVVCSELAWRYANALRLSGIAMLDRDTVTPDEMFRFFMDRGALRIWPKEVPCGKP